MFGLWRSSVPIFADAARISDSEIKQVKYPVS